jgi:pimeloyl-ACP methyl ester carboxylesterase
MTAPDPSRFNFRVSGAGPPLILIHGLAGSFLWWQRNIDACSEHFQTFCVDLVGFGSSRRLGRFDLEASIPLLLAWMNERGIERATVVGHSMGGLIAARFAAIAPDRVDRLVLVDAAFLGFDSGVVKRGIGLVGALRQVPHDFLPLIARDSLRAHPFSLFAATQQLLRSDWGHFLAAIEAPTLIIWGDQDRVTPLKIGKAIHLAIPNSQLVVIEHAGHTPMWDQPDRFNQALLDFLV